MHLAFGFLLVVLLPSISLAGCGTAVPDMQALGDDKTNEKLDEVELVQLIKCELHVGVYDALQKFNKPGGLGGHPVDWLRDWEAKISLKITVDEKITLAPGVTITDPMRNAVSQFNVTYPQSFSASAGLVASSQATRVETIAFNYAFKELLKKPLPPDKNCKNQIARKIVLSDLKIRDFIVNKVYVANYPDAVSKDSGGAPYSVFSDQITFIVTYGWNATPVWKLMRVTASATSPLYNATRTRAHDIVITLGQKGAAEAGLVHNAQLIGQAVASALKDR